MSSIARALGVVAAGVLASAPARAQVGAPVPMTEPPPTSAPPPGYHEAPEMVPRLSAFRLMFGGAAVSRGVYCAYGYYTTGCSSLEYPYAPLDFSEEVEKGLGRLLGLALGVHYMTGPYNDRNVDLWEPTLDFVFRFGSYTAGSSFRFRFGVGWAVAASGKNGFTGRSGIGFTLRGRSRVGLALDAAWEYGSFEGNNFSLIHYQLGP